MGVLSTTHAFTVNDEVSEIFNVPVSSNYMFFVTGVDDDSLGGGTISFESSPNGDIDNWLTIDTLPARGRIVRYLVNGEKVRIVICNATSTPSCTAGIRQ